MLVESSKIVKSNNIKNVINTFPIWNDCISEEEEKNYKIKKDSQGILVIIGEMRSIIMSIVQ